jgi:hypothetical protein
VNLLACAEHAPARGSSSTSPKANVAGCSVARMAFAMRLHPREQLTRTERFGQIVVGAGVSAADLVAFFPRAESTMIGMRPLAKAL